MIFRPPSYMTPRRPVRFHTLIVVCCFCLCAGFPGARAAHASARFVSGYCDGIWVYAVIEENGITWRTDQLAPKMNQRLWANLSDEDKVKLVKTYGWQVDNLAYDFGADGQAAINTFYNAQSGWTALVDKMKTKHADKDFPELAAVFSGSLELPEVHPTCGEVVNSGDYQEVVRLTEEIRTDFALGQGIYRMLVNANWEQVSIAFKSLSGPLIEVIIDNFVTGFITNGASKVSELRAQVYDLMKSFREFIDEKSKTGNKPPDPSELIAKLEEYIKKMEEIATTAKNHVVDKKARLEALVAQVRQMDEACLTSRKTAAAQVITGLTDAVQTAPQPVVPEIHHDPVPATVPPDEREAWIYINMQGKVIAQITSMMDATKALKTTLNDEMSPILNDFGVISPPNLGEPFMICYDGLTSGFDNLYRQVNTIAAAYETWNFEPDITALSQAQSAYRQAGQDAQGFMDSALSRITPVHAWALGLDAYRDYLPTGYPLPSESFASEPLRQYWFFSPVINIIATPEQELSETVKDLEGREAILAAASGHLPSGVDQRREWVKDQYSLYEDLSFNFENSFSFVIAAVRQLDRLHTDPYYEINPDIPAVIISGKTYFAFRFNTAYILSEIEAAGSTPAARMTARQKAVRRMFLLHQQERALIAKLNLARIHTLNDAQALTDYHRFIEQLYRIIDDENSGKTLFEYIKDDVLHITGKEMKSLTELWDNLAPDASYMVVNDGAGGVRWFRDNFGAPLMGPDEYGNPSPMGRVSGRTDTYYEMYQRYSEMEAQKAAILAKPPEEFDKWHTEMQNWGFFAEEWPGGQYFRSGLSCPGTCGWFSEPAFRTL